MSNGFKFEIFDDEGIEAIHQTTLKVLGDPGIRISHEYARKVLKDNGCDVDDETCIVKFPEELVKKAIETAPSSFNIYGRDEKNTVNLTGDGKNVNWINFGIGTKMADYRGPNDYHIRDSTLEDLANIAKVADWASNISYMCSPVSAIDLAGEPVSRTMHEVMTLTENTSKHILVDPEFDKVPYYFELMKAFYGGDEEEARNKSLYTLGGCPTSPLELDYVICEMALQATKYDMPMMVLSMAMSAASSPVFLAGTLVTHNAEVLAGVVLTQLFKPGHPTFYGSSTTSFDIKGGSAPVGSPELGVISAGVAKLAQYYDLPCVVAGS
jgi:trimethylamine--corrinoid protein Co-methyltransferase